MISLYKEREYNSIRHSSKVVDALKTTRLFEAFSIFYFKCIFSYYALMLLLQIDNNIG